MQLADLPVVLDSYALDDLNINVDFWLPATVQRTLIAAQHGDTEAAAMICMLRHADTRCLFCGQPCDCDGMLLSAGSGHDMHAYRACAFDSSAAAASDPKRHSHRAARTTHQNKLNA